MIENVAFHTVHVEVEVPESVSLGMFAMHSAVIFKKSNCF
jgi:hypothetical protein